jgi:hypothetical protein
MPLSLVALPSAVLPHFGVVWGRRIQTTDPEMLEAYNQLLSNKFKADGLTVLSRQSHHNDTYTTVVIGTDELRPQTWLKNKPFYEYEHFFYLKRRKYPTQFDVIQID